MAPCTTSCNARLIAYRSTAPEFHWNYLTRTQKRDHFPPVCQYQDLLFASDRIKAPENPGAAARPVRLTTILAGTANTDNTVATDNR